MEQLELTAECRDNDGIVLLKDKKNGVVQRWYHRIAFDYEENDGGTSIEPKYFKPSAKLNSSYHLCRFCGGLGCLGCAKERERDMKRKDEKK